MRVAAGSFGIPNHNLRFRILSLITALLVACAVSGGFFAEKAYAAPYEVFEVDITNGPVTITYSAENDAKVSYTDSIDGAKEKEFAPSATSIAVFGTSTSNSITVVGSIFDTIPVNIILSGVNIANKNADFCAFALTGKAKVDLTLADGTTNTLQSGTRRAGLEVPSNATVRISGTGTLNAYSDGYGAGIGGGAGEGIVGGVGDSGGTITISGGTVNAHASVSGEGIGAGIGGGGSAGGAGGAGGTITISGGTVNACSSESRNGNGAGIGGGGGSGGLGGAGGTITISGGTVYACSSESGIGYGAGIGGGSTRNNNGGAGGTITISGGTITAGGGSGAADIGQGKVDAQGTNVISGGSVRTLGNGVQPAPSNGATVPTPVYLNTLTLEGGLDIANTALSAGTIDGVQCSETADPANGVYSIKDVVSDTDGKLYFYLPANDADAAKVSLAAANGTTYQKTYKREADATTATLLSNAATPTITAQPVSKTVKLNETTQALSVTATPPDSGNLSYQWFSNSSNSYQGGVAISGAAQSSYTPPANSLGTTYFYCEITNTKDGDTEDETTATIQTNIVSVAVTKLSLSLTLTCADITAGQTPAPQLTGNTGGGAVTFEYKVAGAADSTYLTNVPQTAGAYTVRAKVAETGTHEAAISPEANFTIKAAAQDDPNKDGSSKDALAKTGDTQLSLLVLPGLLAVLAFAGAVLSLRKQAMK